MRKLATIQKISDIQPIENADKIEVANVLGWKVVTRKGEFNIGQLAVYLEIDSWVPHSLAPFLSKDKEPREYEGVKGERLKSVKLRGVTSQGLLLPLNILQENIHQYQEGEDVTEKLGIKKWEPELPASLAGEVKGCFPSYIPKTDEIRLQSFPNLIDEFKGKQVYISTKIDGTSGTITFNKGEIDVCSRKWSLKDTAGNTYWEVVRKYNLIEKLQKYFDETVKNMGIQFEVYGSGIQKNRLNLKEHRIAVFNVSDINNRKYLNYDEFVEFCSKFKIPTVPIFYVGEFKWNSVEEMIELARGKYEGTNNHREGIVIRPLIEGYSAVLNGRASFKVINNDYLLGGGN